ncbi:hypothetical protein EVAR_49855_1 [Eumeta japonica]|uniref:Uncharacterized protein n=1 Tax=Eumeta variegata TaxID=151549 RepID=A0A4C1XYU2_EUMVA|nr:hypothetical protein EVAR_49855_1 [Eumeta japonica]
MVTDACVHLQSQKSHQCVAGVLGGNRISNGRDRAGGRGSGGYQNPHSLDEAKLLPHVHILLRRERGIKFSPESQPLSVAEMYAYLHFQSSFFGRMFETTCQLVLFLRLVRS